MSTIAPQELYKYVEDYVGCSSPIHTYQAYKDGPWFNPVRPYLYWLENNILFNYTSVEHGKT